MTDITRRSIEELQARYFCEPELDDVYVEGLFDKEIFDGCFESVGLRERAVYQIDTVNIDSDVLLKYNLTSGNKQRVLALAKELSVSVGDLSYRCVVDRDLEHWLRDLEVMPCLSWTPYTSIELHFFDLSKKIIVDLGRARLVSFEAFHESFVVVLRGLYALRLVDAELGLCMEWIDLDKFLRVDGDILRFDIDEYLIRLLNKNKLSSRLADFRVRYEYWLGALVGDPRLYIRGHDFTNIIAWSIKAFKGVKDFAKIDVIERLLVYSAKDFPCIVDGVR